MVKWKIHADMKKTTTVLEKATKYKFWSSRYCCLSICCLDFSIWRVFKYNFVAPVFVFLEISLVKYDYFLIQRRPKMKNQALLSKVGCAKEYEDLLGTHFLLD